MRHLTALLALLALTAACGCSSGGGNAPVPRRTAYPRVPLSDTLYIKTPDTPVGIDINSHASASTERRPDGAVWLTVSYPSYRAKILCTFTPVDDASVHEVVDNRTERIRLNAGPSADDIEELLSSGAYYANIIRGQSNAVTPVQFIAVKREAPKWVVSGAAYFPDNTPSTPADSLAPIVNDIYSQVRRMMLSLHDL